MRRDHRIDGPQGEPAHSGCCGVLRTHQQAAEAVNHVQTLGLPTCDQYEKHWDALAALAYIRHKYPKKARILDAGAELYSPILPWLSMCGYRNLEGINLVFDRPIRRGRITYRYGDIAATDYAGHTFDAITCLSVVEHGVDLRAFFREMKRVLCPRGSLILSTDYWDDGVETGGKQAYGVPVKIFTELEIRDAIELAHTFGLKLAAPIDLACEQKVVNWKELDLRFTFCLLTFETG